MHSPGLSFGGGAGGGASSGHRRQRKHLGWWSVFNSWWRSTYDELGRRPRMQEVDQWYGEHAASVWGENEKPSLEQCRDHAKCLRSKSELKDYFQRYHAKKDGRPFTDLRLVRKYRNQGHGLGSMGGGSPPPGDYGPSLTDGPRSSQGHQHRMTTPSAGAGHRSAGMQQDGSHTDSGHCSNGSESLSDSPPHTKLRAASSSLPVLAATTYSRLQPASFTSFRGGCMPAVSNATALLSTAAPGRKDALGDVPADSTTGGGEDAWGANTHSVAAWLANLANGPPPPASNTSGGAPRRLSGGSANTAPHSARSGGPPTHGSVRFSGIKHSAGETAGPGPALKLQRIERSGGGGSVSGLPMPRAVRGGPQPPFIRHAMAMPAPPAMTDQRAMPPPPPQCPVVSLPGNSSLQSLPSLVGGAMLPPGHLPVIVHAPIVQQAVISQPAGSEGLIVQTPVQVVTLQLTLPAAVVMALQEQACRV